jgi:hypothetical protein
VPASLETICLIEIGEGRGHTKKTGNRNFEEMSPISSMHWFSDSQVHTEEIYVLLVDGYVRPT